MSDTSKGDARVGSALTKFARLGFRCVRASRSGQRRGKRIVENMIPGDLIAWAPRDSGYPHIVAEIGGIGKRIGTVFAELTAEPLAAGHVPLLGVVINRKWFWYTEDGERFTDLSDALESLRAA